MYSYGKGHAENFWKALADLKMKNKMVEATRQTLYCVQSGPVRFFSASWATSALGYWLVGGATPRQVTTAVHCGAALNRCQTQVGVEWKHLCYRQNPLALLVVNLFSVKISPCSHKTSLDCRIHTNLMSSNYTTTTTRMLIGFSVLRSNEKVR